MVTINEIFTQKQEIKKSLFISILCPINIFEKTFNDLKIEHQKANHIIYAYRKYNNYFQIIENQTDDGEPKKTSGQPTLNALRGSELINSAIFTIRYFGGIKLGTGGLVRAYSSSANLVISNSNLITFEIKYISSFFISFSALSKFEHYLETNNLDSKKDFIDIGCNVICELNEYEFKDLYHFASSFLAKDFYFLAIPLFAKNM